MGECGDQGRRVVCRLCALAERCGAVNLPLALPHSAGLYRSAVIALLCAVFALDMPDEDVDVDGAGEHLTQMRF